MTPAQEQKSAGRSIHLDTQKTPHGLATRSAHLGFSRASSLWRHVFLLVPRRSRKCPKEPGSINSICYASRAISGSPATQSSPPVLRVLRAQEPSRLAESNSSSSSIRKNPPEQRHAFAGTCGLRKGRYVCSSGRGCSSRAPPCSQHLPSRK